MANQHFHNTLDVLFITGESGLQLRNGKGMKETQNERSTVYSQKKVQLNLKLNYIQLAEKYDLWIGHITFSYFHANWRKTSGKPFQKGVAFPVKDDNLHFRQELRSIGAGPKTIKQKANSMQF